MTDAFEDIKREYVNRFSDTETPFAPDYDTFVSRMLGCIQEALNTTDIGQWIIDKTLCQAISEEWTAEQWQQYKAGVMKMVFFLALEECPQMKHEFAVHLYNELRRPAK